MPISDFSSLERTTVLSLLDVFVIVLVVTLVGLAFWVPAEILRKAGFSRWLALLMPPTGFLGMAIFAFLEWPIERELAWFRFKCGEPPDKLTPLVEGYAVELENKGAWTEAAKVYAELISRSSSEETASYYRNLLQQLKERMGDADAA
jgi:hypothetical protein